MVLVALCKMGWQAGRNLIVVDWLPLPTLVGAS